MERIPPSPSLHSVTLRESSFLSISLFLQISIAKKKKKKGQQKKESISFFFLSKVAIEMTNEYA
jgi:hypothetical protein